MPPGTSPDPAQDHIPMKSRGSRHPPREQTGRTARALASVLDVSNVDWMFQTFQTFHITLIQLYWRYMAFYTEISQHCQALSAWLSVAVSAAVSGCQRLSAAVSKELIAI